MEKGEVELSEIRAGGTDGDATQADQPVGCLLRFRYRLQVEEKFRGVVIAVSFGIQGLLATLLFFVFSRVLANSGRRSNSTWNAISETLQLYQTIFGFLLVSLSSQVARAHQGADFEEVGRLVKLGVITSLVLGFVGEILVLGTAPLVLELFEGNDELLEETPQLVLWSGATFVLSVVNSTLIGILFGKADLIFVAAVFTPALLIAMAGAGLFIASGSKLVVLVVTAATISLYTSIAFGARIWRSRRKYALDSMGNVRLADLRAFAQASGNVAIKTLSIAIKVFLTFLFGTRLNNATGSVLTILQILSSPLLGLASFLGVAATIFAARLLASGHERGVHHFVKISNRLILVGITIFLIAIGITDQGKTLVTEYTDDTDDKILYAQIASPTNMWLWAAGIALQAPAVLYDGMLIAYADWGFVGRLYAADFVFVFLPVILGTQLASNLPIDGNNATDDGGGGGGGGGGFSRLSGILLSLLLHSAVRCMAGLLRVRARMLAGNASRAEAVGGGGDENEGATTETLRKFASSVDPTELIAPGSVDGTVLLAPRQCTHSDDENAVSETL